MTSEIDMTRMYASGEPYLLSLSTDSSERNTKIIKFHLWKDMNVTDISLKISQLLSLEKKIDIMLNTIMQLVTLKPNMLTVLTIMLARKDFVS
jgi:hypothetical protein